MFYDRELHVRRVMSYPPWVALTQIRVQDRNPARGEAAARRLAARLRAGAEGRYGVLGPAPAPFARLKGEHRFQILLKGKSRALIAEGIREVLESDNPVHEVPGNIVVETDPRSLL
jgi:primosomal protein N' (replication factor Y)